MFRKVVINMTLKEFLRKETIKKNIDLDTKLKFVDEFSRGGLGFITLYEAIKYASQDNQLWNSDIIEPLIDEIDKEYFRDVLRPFINKYSVIKVEKRVINIEYDYEYYIQINLDKDNKRDSIILPNFNKNTSMFKKLEPYKCYTLEELGITRMNSDGVRVFIR